MKQIAKVIKQELEAKGTNPYRVAKEAGLPNNAIRYVLEGRQPKIGRLIEIFNALGIDFTIGSAANCTSEPPSPVYMPTSDGLDLEYMLIPRLNIRAAAGSGMLNRYEKVKGHLAFCKEWLHSHGLDAKHCTIIEVKGEGMKPLLKPGEVVLVDTSKRKPEEGKIVAVHIEDDLLIKRARKLEDKRWWLMSENAAYSPIKMRPQYRIIGHVANWKAGQIVPE